MIEKNELKYGLAEIFVDDTKNLPDVKMSLEDDDEDSDDNKYKNASKKPVNKDSKTPVIDSFSRDLTRLASEGKIDPIIGRDREIERVSQILCRRRKNNPILLGEPGCVDSTTIIEVRKISNEGKHNIIISY